jgi:hypothetical protein
MTPDPRTRTAATDPSGAPLPTDLPSPAQADTAAPSPPCALALTTGAVPVDGYTLVRRLGGGGFGQVWEASGPGGLHVALKFVPLGDEVARVELSALEQVKDLRHPHVLSLFASWQCDGYLILAMELAECTLLQRFQQAVDAGGVGIARDVLLVHMQEAASGIDFLNDHGVQHRDIKPQNLLLVGGCVKLADFGLAKVLERTAAPTNRGLMTIPFAAPERFQGQVSRMSDQYSLAITYCYLRGGRLPFEGEEAAIVAGHLMEPPDLSMLAAAERPAVGRALEKDPHARWPSCRQFVQSLEEAGKSTRDIPTAPFPSKQKAAAPDGRKRAVVLGVVAGLVGLAVAAALIFGRGGPPPAGPASLHLQPPGETTLLLGKTQAITVHLERRNCPDEVVLQLEGLPDGVSCPGGRFAAETDEARLELTATGGAALTTANVRVTASSPHAQTESVFRLEVTFDRQAQQRALREVPVDAPTETDGPGGPVILVNLTGQTSFDDEALAKLAGLPRLQILDLSGADVDDAGLAHLSGLTELKKLNLSLTSVTGAGLAHLAGLGKLRSLSLSGLGLDDAGLRSLAAMTGLQELDLSGDNVSDDGLGELARLTDLRTLNLSGDARLTDKGVAQLKGLKKLHTLLLNATAIGDADLELVTALPQLQELSLNDTRVGDEGLKRLRGMTRLTKLNLTNTRVTDAGLESLKDLSKLRDLGLSADPEVTDRGVAALAGLAGLMELRLSSTGIGDEGLKRLKSLKSLKKLELHDVKVSPKAIQDFHKDRPNVTLLYSPHEGA